MWRRPPLNDLAAAGLVERHPDAADRRRNVVTITEPGRKRLTELDGVVAGLQEALLAPLPAADRATLIRLLTRGVDHHRTG